MKKILLAFLFMFSFCFTKIEAKETLFQHIIKEKSTSDGGTIKVDQYYVDGRYAYCLIQKERENDFIYKAEYKEQYINLYYFYEGEESYFFFGDVGDTRVYSSYLLELSKNGEKKGEYVHDNHKYHYTFEKMIEYKNNVYMFSSGYFEPDDNDNPYVIETEIIKLNSSLEKENTVTVDFKVEYANFILDTLFVNDEEKHSSDYAYDLNLDIADLDKEIKVNGTLIIDLDEQYYLNNESSRGRREITEPGSYLLTNKEKNITKKYYLYPIVEGVTDKESYDNPVTITTTGGLMYLNGKQYLSEEISEPGKYKLDIYGNTKLVVSFEFYINPKMNNIENGAVYNEEVTPEFTGTAKINGEDFEPGQKLTEGEYELDLYRGDEVYQSYNFKVVENEEKKTISKDAIIIDLVLLVAISVGIFFIVKKK